MLESTEEISILDRDFLSIFPFGVYGSSSKYTNLLGIIYVGNLVNKYCLTSTKLICEGEETKAVRYFLPFITFSIIADLIESEKELRASSISPISIRIPLILI